MTRSGDDEGDMARRRPRTPAGPLLDELTAERLVSRAAAPGDVPPAFAPVARLLQAATGPAQDHELEGEAAARRMFLAELGAAGSSAPPVPGKGPKGSSPIARRFAAAAVVAGSLVVGGGVAAATGNLPPTAQSAAHDTLDAIGVDVPEPPEESGAKTTGKGSDSSGPGKESAFCAAATTGPCAVGRDDPAEDPGSIGGVEPADPGDLGGTPGSVGPSSSSPGGSADPSASTSEDPSDSTSTDPSGPRDATPTDPDEPSDDTTVPDTPTTDTTFVDPPTTDTTVPDTPTTDTTVVDPPPTDPTAPPENDPGRSTDPPEPEPEPEP
jgi:hypothetical protein